MSEKTEESEQDPTGPPEYVARHGGPPPAKSDNTIKYLLAAIAACGLILFAFAPVKTVWYQVQTPYQVPETYYVNEPYQVQKAQEVQVPYEAMESQEETVRDSLQIIGGMHAVKASSSVYWSKQITLHDYDKVTGSLSEESGHDISFLIMDQKNYNSWKADSTYQAYVRLSKISSRTFSFIPDHTDVYYFVLDNEYSWITPKVVDIDCTWEWNTVKTSYVPVTKYRTETEYKTVTEYRQVPKQRTVTKYQTEQKTKKVSALEYLIHY